MIDLVFNESAGGSLKLAQSWGDGPCPMPCIGIAYEPGEKPAFWKVWQDKRREKRKFRQAWNSAVPLKTAKEDIFVLNLSLQYGDVAEDGFWRKRKAALRELLRGSYETDQLERQLQSRMETVKGNLETIAARLAEGENIRIWYGDNAEDRCMLAWFGAQVQARKLPKPQVLVNVLPKTYDRGDGTKVRWSSWGEVEPARWGRLDQELRQQAKGEFLQEQAKLWARLQAENSGLRIWEKGTIQSVPEEYYDNRIRAEIGRQPREFREPEVIGNLMGQGLPASDEWIAGRIEKLVRSGELEVVSEETPGTGSYRRTLRRR